MEMKKPNDIVTRFIERGMIERPQSSTDWQALGDKLRLEYDSTPGVWKPVQPTKTERLMDLMARGITASEARRRVGASRMTAWRALNRPWDK